MMQSSFLSIKLSTIMSMIMMMMIGSLLLPSTLANNDVQHYLQHGISGASGYTYADFFLPKADLHHNHHASAALTPIYLEAGTGTATVAPGMAPGVEPMVATAVAPAAMTPLFTAVPASSIDAAIHSKRSVSVLPVNEQHDEPKVNQVSVEAAEMPLVLTLKSKSSPLVVNAVHHGEERGSMRKTNSVDAPHIRVHETLKPVLQEIREIVQPKRHITQLVSPVLQKINTLASAHGAPSSSAAASGAALAAPALTPALAPALAPVQAPTLTQFVAPAAGPAVPGSILASALPREPSYFSPMQQYGDFSTGYLAPFAGPAYPGPVAPGYDFSFVGETGTPAAFTDGIGGKAVFFNGNGALKSHKTPQYYEGYNGEFLGGYSRQVAKYHKKARSANNRRSKPKHYL